MGGAQSGMDAGAHPVLLQVVETMRKGEGGVDLDSHRHEGPALVADVAAGATGAHIVIVRQVDVKHQFPLAWLEAVVCAQACKCRCILLVTGNSHGQVNAW